MSKPKPILISIPHPCTQNRDEMTHTAGGRYCAHCLKTVIDFTTWSDAALYDFFSKNTGNVCGTFSQNQLNRSINIPYQPHSKLYRLTIALGLTLIFTQTTDVLAQNFPPKTEQTSILKLQKPDSAGSGSIYGNVLDEKKEPLPSTIIQVHKDGILKGGAATDIDGNYTITPLEPGVYDVLVLYAGYDSIMANSVIVTDNVRTKLNFNMSLSHKSSIMSGAVITNYKKPLIDIDNPDKRTFTRDEINHIPK